MLDVIIYHGYVITMEGNGVGLIEDGAVGIKGNNIEAVGKADVVMKNYKAHRYIDATNKVIMPGLIDAHLHSAIGILKGLAQDMDNWLQKGIWPFRRLITVEESVKGSMKNIIEGVKAGTTTFCDFDLPMRELVKNHGRLGTRARVANTINELPPNIDNTKVGDLYPLDSSIGQLLFNDSIKLFEEWHQRDNGRITCVLGPQAPDRVSKELLLEIKNLAEKYDTSIHMHVACGTRETNQMLQRYNKRSIPFLEEIGYLNKRLMGVHLSIATKEELEQYAKSGAVMILCSGSEAIVDGNIPPAAEFLEFSEKFALGSDQAPGNNCNNMFNEMKFTAILNKCRVENPTVFPAWRVLRMATVDAANAIGLGNEIGSLKPGKKADIILIDLNRPNMRPVYTYPIRNIIPNLVYSANGSEVETVIIDGKFIMEDRKILVLDEEKELKEEQHAAECLAKRVAKDIEHFDTPLIRMMEEEQL